MLQFEIQVPAHQFVDARPKSSLVANIMTGYLQFIWEEQPVVGDTLRDELPRKLFVASHRELLPFLLFLDGLATLDNDSRKAIDRV